ncbi:murein transglycosylase [Proteus myxofaciens]|uniref:peptidoglycan lytic exotransglycosylase n=1 Tax=Proteus myxofaciens ATCC 19692 TaxID=1354337 RepID=A0A198FMJ3_9GAMM|nr:murein transglycosylase [Proteus myxofaciens]OAT26172.1 soluble lytic murein transglycosylase [Proteus myxofaciens ATCC 19692]
MAKQNWALVLTIGALCFSSWVQANPLDEQRTRYQQIKTAWDQNNTQEVERLLPTLKDYPLYPYLEYRQITDNLDIISPVVVTEFVSKYPTLPPAKALPSLFVNELAKREEWQNLLTFSPNPPNPKAARCNYYYAKWATGDTQTAWIGAKEAWLNGTSMPSSCDPLFDEWQKTGQLTPELVLERIDLAIKKGNTGLAAYLARRLPANYQTISDALVELQDNPELVSRYAKSLSPTDFTRSIVQSAFSRWARKDADGARAQLDSIAHAQKMTESERQLMKDTVAWQYMPYATPEQVKWRDSVIQDTASDTLRERRVRLALSQNQPAELALWIERLSPESKNKEEWRYWRAMVLQSQGKKSEAQSILEALTQNRGFYPMVAAYKLNKPYVMVIDKAPSVDSRIHSQAEVQRVRELMYWQMDNLARSEWANFVASQPAQMQSQLARYAFEQNWADLAVQATITGKMWDHLEERFPLAWKEEFEQYTKDKGIDRNYAMAIARQESAWNPQARSSAGATGLMQVMPKTAEHTVKQAGITGYSSSAQLTNPVKNIEIGTAYLDSVYQRFNQNRILASAAYNAGPARVDRWLSDANGQLDAIAFVESIPFAETRGYVKNVLSFAVFYSYFAGDQQPVLTETEWRYRY